MDAEQQLFGESGAIGPTMHWQDWVARRLAARPRLYAVADLGPPFVGDSPIGMLGILRREERAGRLPATAPSFHGLVIRARTEADELVSFECVDAHQSLQRVPAVAWRDAIHSLEAWTEAAVEDLQTDERDVGLWTLIGASDGWSPQDEQTRMLGLLHRICEAAWDIDRKLAEQPIMRQL